jgi:hypothetical protein
MVLDGMQCTTVCSAPDQVSLKSETRRHLATDNHNAYDLFLASPCIPNRVAPHNAPGNLVIITHITTVVQEAPALGAEPARS